MHPRKPLYGLQDSTWESLNGCSEVDNKNGNLTKQDMCPAEVIPGKGDGGRSVGEGERVTKIEDEGDVEKAVE